VVVLLLLLLLLQSRMPLPTADAADLLQLAINCSCDAVVEAALSRIPARLDAAAARRLLLTAALRHNAEVTSRLAKKPAVRQHIDAPTLSAVLDLLYHGASHESDSWWRANMAVKQLRDPQAVVEEVDVLAESLHDAVTSRAARFARPLFQLANVQLLGVNVMLQLLSDAVHELDSDEDDDDYD
jgi:hypothetical protein